MPPPLHISKERVWARAITLFASLLVLLSIPTVAAGCAPAGPRVDRYSFPVEIGSGPLVVIGEHLVHGLSVISIREQAIVATLPGRTLPARVVTAAGDRLWLGDSSSVQVFDLSDPTNPVLLGTKEHDDVFRRQVTDISVGDDGVVWVATGTRVLQMDATDPANIRTLSEHDIEGETFQVQGRVGYTASGYGPGVWDLSSGAPVLVTRPVENRAGTGVGPTVHARGRHLAATLDGYLYLFTIDDPLAPVMVARVGDPIPGTSRVAYGDTAHLQVWDERHTFARHWDGSMSVVDTLDGHDVLDPEGARVGTPGSPIELSSTERFMPMNSGNTVHMFERLD